MPDIDEIADGSAASTKAQAPEGDAQPRRLGRRGWIAVGAIAAVVVALAVAAGIIITQQNEQSERVAAARADLAAFTAAQSELIAANEDYASAVLAASTEATVYQEILAKVKPTGIFEAAAVAEYEAAIKEFTELTPGPREGTDLAQWQQALRADPASALALEQPTVSGLSAEEVTDAYSSGGDDYETIRATVTGDATTLTHAAENVGATRAELEAAHANVAEATAVLAAATALSPDAVVAELPLASDESKLAFTAAHASVTALESTARAQAALDAVTAYLDSHAAVKASNQTIVAERAAEEERIQREKVGTITVLTDALNYVTYDQCILAPGSGYTRTFDISNGQDHTTGPDSGQVFDIWTYTIDGGTVSFLKCYAD